MDKKILRRKEGVKRKSEEKKWQGERETINLWREVNRKVRECGLTWQTRRQPGGKWYCAISIYDALQAFSKLMVVYKAQLEVILHHPAFHVRSHSVLLGHIRGEYMDVKIHWFMGWYGLVWSLLQRGRWALEGYIRPRGGRVALQRRE